MANSCGRSTSEFGGVVLALLANQGFVLHLLRLVCRDLSTTAQCAARAIRAQT